jgi:predicted nucleic acid-binding protein
MRVFLDTNILYTLYRVYIRNDRSLTHSSLRNSEEQLITSTHIIFELESICGRDRTRLPIDHIVNFLSYMNILIHKSNERDNIYRICVYDPDDLHVIQDCIQSHSSLLLTHNIRDFNRPSIALYGVNVVNHLPS